MPENNTRDTIRGLVEKILKDSLFDNKETYPVVEYEVHIKRVDREPLRDETYPSVFTGTLTELLGIVQKVNGEFIQMGTISWITQEINEGMVVHEEYDSV